jgi:hypothetical protein
VPSIKYVLHLVTYASHDAQSANSHLKRALVSDGKLVKGVGKSRDNISNRCDGYKTVVFQAHTQIAIVG